MSDQQHADDDLEPGEVTADRAVEQAGTPDVPDEPDEYIGEDEGEGG